MNLRGFLIVAVAALVTVQAKITQIDHDAVEPFAQPKPTTHADKAAVKYKPLLTVSYGCYPYPAVQKDGAVSAGLKPRGPIDGECTGSDLGSQVYARSGWYKDIWAIMYTWYLPKGRPGLYKRRHYWETAIVWIDDPRSDNSTLLAVSLNYGRRMKTEKPVPARYLNGSNVKVEQYRGFGFPRPKLRFTEHEGQSIDLITWDQLPAVARDSLNEAKFDTTLFKGFKQKMPLKDGVFEERLDDAWPF
ncbi:Necrosis inducing protein NPP1 [Phytophthora megakarya]|uniref:Necrosis inducing protein NPP1 n=1 Tax=Phytophthora megakarya TaxID=4795 RepID=A0A225WP98_9STRA|nr:Necrosis inducing protein NPP1 [Phytophthora megakarya]